MSTYYVTFAICYRPSVCRLSVCCLSVTLVHPTQAVELFSNFFHHTIAQGLYFSDAKNRWWGRPFPSEICVQSDPPSFQTAKFRPISAHSTSTASERSSTTRFPTNHRWTVYVTPKSPKGDLGVTYTVHLWLVGKRVVDFL